MRAWIDLFESQTWLDALSDKEQTALAEDFFNQVVFTATKGRYTISSCAEFFRLGTPAQRAFFDRIVARWEREGMYRPGTEEFMNWLSSVWYNHKAHDFKAPLAEIFPPSGDLVGGV